MNRAVALADRLAMPALKLLAAINVLFFLSFLLVAAFAVGQARAETPVCTGVDLMQALRKDDPAAARRIEEDARATPNGSGLLWKIEKAGLGTSYLFGTMHMTDPRVTALPGAAQAAFDASATVVIETTDVLDQAEMMAAIMQKPELMMFTDQTTLQSLLSQEDAAAVEAALAERGIPLGSVSKMKPWMLSAMVALPACEMARKAAGLPVLDVKLAQDAEASGKELRGLETVTDQLEAMASLPMDFHIRGLVDTLKLGDRMDDVDRDDDLPLRTGRGRRDLAAVQGRTAGQRRRGRLRRVRGGHGHRAQQDDGRRGRADPAEGRCLRRHRRPSPAGRGRRRRAAAQGGLYGHASS